MHVDNSPPSAHSDSSAQSPWISRTRLARSRPLASTASLSTAKSCREAENSTPYARRTPNSRAAWDTDNPRPLPQSTKTSSGPRRIRSARLRKPRSVISPYLLAKPPPMDVIASCSARVHLVAPFVSPVFDAGMESTSWTTRGLLRNGT